MANEQNLRPFTSDQDREEAAKNGRKGGVASGKARRQKKAVREVAEQILAMDAPLSDAQKAQLRNLTKAKNADLTVQFVGLFRLAQKALSGDKAALEMLIAYAGEAPTKSVDINGSVPVVLSGDEDIED